MAAIFVAAGALFVGLVNIVVTLWQGHITRKETATRENREQWWDRFVWAAERVEGPDEDLKELGATVLGALASVDWVEASDKDMIDAILEDITNEVSEEDVEEASVGQDN